MGERIRWWAQTARETVRGRGRASPCCGGGRASRGRFAAGGVWVVGDSRLEGGE
jgi:hypothetical protein